MFYYETHLHTSPVSKCAKKTVRENLEFYKSIHYDGVFITNHFINGNINMDRNAPYEDLIKFYFSDFHEAEAIAEEIGIKVFDGVETSYKGSDFLVFGLHEDWFLAHPEIQEMDIRKQCRYFRENGALVIQAHPFREEKYIDHIRLYPDVVDGIEVINAGRTEMQNKLAQYYADSYGFLQIAGSDNHRAGECPHLAGIRTEEPIESVDDFIRMVKEKQTKIFVRENF